MPNSRVRALTENASTPATPTTAMSSATPEKPPNTNAFRRAGESTSARMSSMAGGALDRLVGRDAVCTIFVMGVTSVYGIGLRVHEDAALMHLLLERVVDGHRRLGHDVLVVEVGGHADDAPSVLAHADEVGDRVGPHQHAVHRVLPGEHPPRQTLADDHDLFGVLPVALVEVAAGHDRHAERGEEARTRRERNCARGSSSPLALL